MDYDPNNKIENAVDTAKTEVKSHVVVVSIIAVAVLAFAAYLFYANHTEQPVFSSATVTNGVEATKDAVKPDSAPAESTK